MNIAALHKPVEEGILYHHRTLADGLRFYLPIVEDHDHYHQDLANPERSYGTPVALNPGDTPRGITLARGGLLQDARWNFDAHEPIPALQEIWTVFWRGKAYAGSKSRPAIAAWDASKPGFKWYMGFGSSGAAAVAFMYNGGGLYDWQMNTALPSSFSTGDMMSLALRCRGSKASAINLWAASESWVAEFDSNEYPAQVLGLHEIDTLRVNYDGTNDGGHGVDTIAIWDRYLSDDELRELMEPPGDPWAVMRAPTSTDWDQDTAEYPASLRLPCAAGPIDQSHVIPIDQSDLASSVLVAASANARRRTQAEIILPLENLTLEETRSLLAAWGEGRFASRGIWLQLPDEDALHLYVSEDDTLEISHQTPATRRAQVRLRRVTSPGFELYETYEYGRGFNRGFSSP